MTAPCPLCGEPTQLRDPHAVEVGGPGERDEQGARETGGEE